MNKLLLITIALLFMILSLSWAKASDLNNVVSDSHVIEMFDRGDKTLISICDKTFIVCDRLLVPNDRLKDKAVEDWADMIFKKRIK